VRVLDTEEVEVFLPVRPFLLQRCGAETGFDPVGRAVVADAGLLHVVYVFITGQVALAQGDRSDDLQEGLLPAGLYAGFNEGTHGGLNSKSEGRNPKEARRLKPEKGPPPVRLRNSLFVTRDAFVIRNSDFFRISTFGFRISPTWIYPFVSGFGIGSGGGLVRPFRCLRCSGR